MTTTKYVVWIEPFTEDYKPVFMVCSPQTAIKKYREIHTTQENQLTDEDALHEFCVVNWADVIEIDSEKFTSMFNFSLPVEL